jgi:hypothetical protein
VSKGSKKSKKSSAVAPYQPEAPASGFCLIPKGRSTRARFGRVPRHFATLEVRRPVSKGSKKSKKPSAVASYQPEAPASGSCLIRKGRSTRARFGRVSHHFATQGGSRRIRRQRGTQNHCALTPMTLCNQRGNGRDQFRRRNGLSQVHLVTAFEYSAVLMGCFEQTHNLESEVRVEIIAIRNILTRSRDFDRKVYL